MDEEANKVEEPYWRNPDHEYEPPVHDPQYHEDFPEGPQRTYLREPVYTRAHPAERDHRTYAEAKNEEDGPENYFYEFPEVPNSEADEEMRENVEDMHLKEDHRNEDEKKELSESLNEELAKRHLGHKVIEKKPVLQTTSLSGITDTNLRSFGVTQVVETLYDDLSAEKKSIKTEIDQMIDSTVGFAPGDDGILNTFIDRYTTMLIHDSILMEEIPAPHFMHQGISVLSPELAGSLKYDPRESQDEPRSKSDNEDDEDDNDFEKHPTMHSLLKDSHKQDRSYAHHEPSADQSRN